MPEAQWRANVRDWLNTAVGHAGRSGLARAIREAEATVLDPEGLEQAYIAAAHGSTWAAALDERCGRLAGDCLNQMETLRKGDSGGMTALGLRHARNRLLHAMPVALNRDPPRFLLGGPGSMLHLARGFYWVALSDLGSDRRDNVAARDAYGPWVAGRSLHKPLTLAARWIEELAR